MIKVFIVDDHEILRTGLKKILTDEPDIKVVGEAENGTDLLKAINETDCDILLLDLNIPGRNGIELIEEIKRRKPSVKILVFSVNPENKSALPTLNAGAAGYLSKDSALSELVNAIRKVNEKGRYMSTNLAEQLAFNLLSNNSENDNILTSMESNIAIMIANGKPAKIVADELGLSTSTVFTHRRKIFNKLKIKNNVQLANYVIEHEMSNF
jgi:Response regulator containing a CheY-like receiver domain and an HTH DNA-binding domain